MYSMDCDISTPAKILIVDDDDTAVLELTRLLEPLGQIQTETTGESALATVAGYQPDVILLDIEMPGIDGFAVCEQLRNNPQTRHIAVVFVTAHAQQENQIASLTQGAIDFIAKPIDHKVCELRVRNLLLLQKQKRHLQQQKDYLDIILGSVAEGVIATDVQGLVTYVNPKAELIIGWRVHDALGKPVEQVMQLRDPDTRINTENPIRVVLRQQRVTHMPLSTQLIARDGRVAQIEQSAAPLRGAGGQLTGAVAVIHDVSHSISLSMLRSQASSYDQLTNVANRLFIREKLQLACDAVKVSEIQMAMAVIDVDHFKYFNDAHGNRTGDAVLKALARRLFDNYEPEHSIGRLGADEFMVILRLSDGSEPLEQALAKLLELLRTPMTVDGERFSLSVSIGVSQIDAHCSEPDTIMQQADAALYRAKFEGGDRFKVFTDELERSLLQRRSTEELLRKSLQEQDMIRVFYQPKVDLHTGKTIGAEALVRICDDHGKLISPLEFIPIAEESGLILQLGAIVMQQACLQCQRWLSMGFDVPVSVNISALQCLSDDLVDLVRETLYTSNIAPDMLELEVTETAYIRDFEATRAKFTTLREMGVKLSIDDFGKGYSNLTYLRQLDIDTLKLDMSYVRGMLNNQRDYEIVKTIVNLGSSMEMTLVAEGIESTAHRDELLKLGCQLGQGYLYSRPLSADDFVSYLQHPAT